MCRHVCAKMCVLSAVLRVSTCVPIGGNGIDKQKFAYYMQKGWTQIAKADASSENIVYARLPQVKVVVLVA